MGTQWEPHPCTAAITPRALRSRLLIKPGAMAIKRFREPRA